MCTRSIGQPDAWCGIAWPSKARRRFPVILTTGQSLIFLNDGKAGFGTTMAFGPAVTNARAPGAVWFNAGDGRRFTDVRFGDGRGAVYGLALGDLNGDGFPDIAVAMSDAPNAVFFSMK